MEYLKVEFEERRRVMVNNVPNGFTNSVIEAPGGAHTVTLAGGARRPSFSSGPSASSSRRARTIR